MSTESPMDIYRAACARYTSAVVDASNRRDSAAARYRAEVNEVRDGAQQAVAGRDQAAREADAAKKLVAETDDASADIWRRLTAYIGTKHTGMTPPPDSSEPLESAAEVRSLLARTKRTIALVQRGELPFAPPKRALPVAAIVGAIVGAAAAIGAGLLLGGGSANVQAMRQAAALVVVFVGVFAGIPIVTGWLAVRHRIRARPVHIGACIGGALVAIFVLAPFTFA